MGAEAEGRECRLRTAWEEKGEAGWEEAELDGGGEGRGPSKIGESSESGPSLLAPTPHGAGKPRGALHWRRAELQFREQSLG